MNLKQKGSTMRKENKGKKGSKEKSRPKDSGSAVRLEWEREREVTSVTATNRSGTDAARTLQGAFRAMARGDSREKKKKLIGFRRKNKGKPTCSKDGLASKEGKIILFDCLFIKVVFILLPGEPWWSGHWEI